MRRSRAWPWISNGGAPSSDIRTTLVLCDVLCPTQIFPALYRDVDDWHAPRVDGTREHDLPLQSHLQAGHSPSPLPLPPLLSLGPRQGLEDGSLCGIQHIEMGIINDQARPVLQLTQYTHDHPPRSRNRLRSRVRCPLTSRQRSRAS